MKWLKWALGEAACRTISMSMQKKIGEETSYLKSTPDVMTFLLIFSTFVIGIVQSVVAGSILITRRISIFPSTKLVFGSILFGIGAFVNTMFAFVAYGYNANMAVYTFIVLLSIVPNAFLDRLIFGRTLVMRQCVGIACAVVAGWLVLKTPDFSELKTLPIWVWIGFLNAIGLSVNQGITQWVKDVNPWVKNFWGGIATSLCCVGTFAVFSEYISITLSASAFSMVLYWSIAIAFVVIGIWSYNVIAYRDGATIATKHVVVNGTFLSLAVIAGFLLFGEQVALIQVLGMLVYLGAFVLINNEVWYYFWNKRTSVT